ATVGYLQGLPIVRPDRIGITGFCAAFPLVFACHNPRIACAVSFYNQMHYGPDTQADPTVMPIDRLPSLWCPWQGHYGAEDGAIPLDQREEFLKVAARYKKSVDLHVYPGAGHGFAEPGGRAYHQHAATQAWDRAKAFFARHLKG
ncbi:MAG: dienelactone hydrolase family protein, partial [SAR202 cluster bacterium]|nr:dienelactone hydrolase family protein [SAR202 cluster bacterium]